MKNFAIFLAFAIFFVNSAENFFESEKRFMPIETFYRRQMPAYIRMMMGRKTKRNINEGNWNLDVPFPNFSKSVKEKKESQNFD